MDNSPLNNLKMNAEERLQKLNTLRSKIMELKFKSTNSPIKTKKTIQKLQQEIDNLPKL
jgi:hypothetical protein